MSYQTPIPKPEEITYYMISLEIKQVARERVGASGNERTIRTLLSSYMSADDIASLLGKASRLIALEAATLAQTTEAG